MLNQQGEGGQLCTCRAIGCGLFMHDYESVCIWCELGLYVHGQYMGGMLMTV